MSYAAKLPLPLHRSAAAHSAKSCGARLPVPVPAPPGLSTREMEDRHDDDDGHGAGSLDAPADAIIDPALDPSLVGSGGESTNQPSQRSQLPSASAGHELLALLDDETGHATFDGNSTANATNQAFWDAMPLGDTLVRPLTRLVRAG